MKPKLYRKQRMFNHRGCILAPRLHLLLFYPFPSVLKCGLSRLHLQLTLLAFAVRLCRDYYYLYTALRALTLT